MSGCVPVYVCGGICVSARHLPGYKWPLSALPHIMHAVFWFNLNLLIRLTPQVRPKSYIKVCLGINQRWSCKILPPFPPPSFPPSVSLLSSLSPISLYLPPSFSPLVIASHLFIYVFPFPQVNAKFVVMFLCFERDEWDTWGVYRCSCNVWSFLPPIMTSNSQTLYTMEISFAVVHLHSWILVLENLPLPSSPFMTTHTQAVYGKSSNDNNPCDRWTSTGVVLHPRGKEDLICIHVVVCLYSYVCVYVCTWRCRCCYCDDISVLWLSLLYWLYIVRWWVVMFFLNELFLLKSVNKVRVLFPSDVKLYLLFITSVKYCSSVKLYFSWTYPPQDLSAT